MAGPPARGLARYLSPPRSNTAGPLPDVARVGCDPGLRRRHEGAPSPHKQARASDIIVPCDNDLHGDEPSASSESKGATGRGRRGPGRAG